MLLRGIAFAEARRSSARRVFKNRDKTQGNGSERDALDLSHDGSLARHVRTVPYQPAKVPLVFPIPFVSCEKDINYSKFGCTSAHSMHVKAVVYKST